MEVHNINMDLTSYRLALKTKPQSLAFGRHLYQLLGSEQQYWLKTHQRNVYETLERSYLHELSFYQNAQKNLDFMLPHRLCMPSHASLDLDAHPCLILPHAKAFLTQAPQNLSIFEVEQCIWKMLESVEQLHALGFIHADLKHEHFLQWNNHAVLIDFEQVQRVGEQQLSLTATPRYMAPELFHGQSKTVQSDLYALGIVLYEWLTQQRLIAKTYQDWAYLHCQQLHIDLPKPFKYLENCLCGLLAKQKTARFLTICEAKRSF